MAFAADDGATSFSNREEENDNENDGEGEGEGEGWGGEATDDYSSFWRSIPDPPAPVAASSSAADDDAIATATTTSAAAPPITATAAVVTNAAKARKSAVSARRRASRKRDSLAFRDVTNRRAAVPSGGGDSKDSGKPHHAPVVAPPVRPSESSLASKSPGVEDGAGLVFGKAGREETAVEEKKRGKRRRRKRQSLLLPSDSGLPLTAGRDPAGSSSECGTTSSSKEGLVEANDKPVGAAITTNREMLARLVRDYCSLPEERRANSNEARSIEALSGYPMPGKSLPSMRDDADAKREFLLRVRPIVQEMEGRKRKDAADTRLATRCEARKDGSGGFRYHDAESGEEVPGVEYERRYAAMIEEGRRKRRAMAGGHEGGQFRTRDDVGKEIESGLVELERSQESKTEQGRCDVPHNPGDSEVKEMRIDGVSMERENCGHSPADSGMDMDESVNMDDSTAGNDNGIEMSPVEIPSPGKDEADGSTNPLNDDSPATIDYSSPDGPTERPVGTTQGNSCEEVPGRRRGDGPAGSRRPLLAGMPDTDDPRVLAARERLRCAIDAALAEYSREMLAIEQAAGDEDVLLPND